MKFEGSYLFGIAWQIDCFVRESSQNRYWDKLQPMCVAKPESYEERKKRREAEIAGLKEALRILEEESGSAFLQIRSIRRA